MTQLQNARSVLDVSEIRQRKNTLIIRESNLSWGESFHPHRTLKANMMCRNFWRMHPIFILTSPACSSCPCLVKRQNKVSSFADCGKRVSTSYSECPLHPSSWMSWRDPLTL